MVSEEELKEVFDQSRGHDVVAPEAEVLVIEASPLAAYEPWTPPKTGSKGYQRRQNQRWPKGR